MATKQSRDRPYLSGADFDLNGERIERDWRYRYYFQFLQMSPSYWAVHRHRKGERNVALPADLKVVERVYDDFGDVFSTYFLDWWLKRGRRAFGRSLGPFSVDSLWCGMTSGFDLSGFHSGFDKHWKHEPASKADVPLIVLSVPMTGSPADILRQVKAHLAKMEPLRVESEAKAQKYQVVANKMREKTLRDARKVFRARLAQPKSQLWRIGNLVKLAPLYETDPKAKPTGNIGDSREMMAIIISRHLHRAHLLAENAARGIFPSLKPTDSLDFDIPGQRAWLMANIKFMEVEVRRLKAQLADLRARKAVRMKS